MLRWNLTNLISHETSCGISDWSNSSVEPNLCWKFSIVSAPGVFFIWNCYLKMWPISKWILGKKSNLDGEQSSCYLPIPLFLIQFYFAGQQEDSGGPKDWRIFWTGSVGAKNFRTSHAGNKGYPGLAVFHLTWNYARAGTAQMMFQGRVLLYFQHHCWKDRILKIDFQWRSCHVDSSRLSVM